MSIRAESLSAFQPLGLQRGEVAEALLAGACVESTILGCLGPGRACEVEPLGDLFVPLRELAQQPGRNPSDLRGVVVNRPPLDAQTLRELTPHR